MTDVGAVVVPQSISDAFLAQGIVGAVALGAIILAAFFYRMRETDRTKNEDRLGALQLKYEAVIQKLQQDRINEMKTGMAQLSDAMKTVESTNNTFEAALEMLKGHRA